MRFTKKIPLMLCLLSIGIFLTAQSSTLKKIKPIKTYHLRMASFETNYGNTFTDKDISIKLTSYLRLPERGNLIVQLTMEEGLGLESVTSKPAKNSRYYYNEITYLTPTYQAIVKDRYGRIIWEKHYSAQQVVHNYELNGQLSEAELILNWENKSGNELKRLEKESLDFKQLEIDLNNFLSDSKPKPQLAQTNKTIAAPIKQAQKNNPIAVSKVATTKIVKTTTPEPKAIIVQAAPKPIVPVKREIAVPITPEKVVVTPAPTQKIKTKELAKNQPSFNASKAPNTKKPTATKPLIIESDTIEEILAEDVEKPSPTAPTQKIKAKELAEKQSSFSAPKVATKAPKKDKIIKINPGNTTSTVIDQSLKKAQTTVAAGAGRFDFPPFDVYQIQVRAEPNGIPIPNKYEDLSGSLDTINTAGGVKKKGVLSVFNGKQNGTKKSFMGSLGKKKEKKDSKKITPAVHQARIGWHIGLGRMPIVTDNGSIRAVIIDDSDVPDVHNTTTPISKQKSLTYLRIGISGDDPNINRSFGVFFDYGFKNGDGIDKYEIELNYGLSKVIGPLRINPQLGVNLGNSSVALGQMIRQTPFITIGKKDFFSDVVDISYRNQFAGLSAKVNVAYKLKNMDINFFGGYTQGFSLRKRLRFTGDDGNDSPIRAKRKLPNDKTTININTGDNSNDKLFGFSGLKLGVGLRFRIDGVTNFFTGSKDNTSTDYSY